MFAPDPTLTGTLLANRYRVVYPIARGGMGMVYEAEDVTLGRRVAIKLMRDASDPTARERFRREARAIAATSHPSLVSVHDVVDDGDRPFIVMELLEGRSVADILASEGAVDWRRAVGWMVGVLDAIEQLHSVGIIHRDLKPANIVIVRDDDAERAKVIDLGVAREVAASGTLTVAGALVGTPAFMAPEQLRGAPVEAAADIWAVGAILANAVTGETSADRSAARMRDTLAARGAPPSLADVLGRMLAIDPAERPSTAGAAAAALRSLRVREAETALVGPSVVGPAATRPTPPKTLLIATAVLGMFAAGAIVAFVWPHAATPTTTRRENIPYAPAPSTARTAPAIGPRGEYTPEETRQLVPRSLQVTHRGPDAEAAAQRVAPRLDPMLRACVDLPTHALGAPVAIYTVWLARDGTPSRLEVNRTEASPSETACIERALRATTWPPPTTEHNLAMVSMVPML